MNYSNPSNGYHLFELENGLRVIFSQSKKSMMVYCGILIGSGSRDENEKNNGVAHFIEHSVFKGTSKRRSFNLMNRLESVGGELNAFTTRERTMYYTASLKKFFDRSMEILTDIVFNPLFPPNEIEKEKKVIEEEIEMYEDSAEESIYDDFYRHLFPDNSMGFNILGSRFTLTGIDRDCLQHFWKQNYTTDNIVVSIAGGVTPDKVQRIINKYLNDIPYSAANRLRNSPNGVMPFNKSIDKEFQQTHCIIGKRAFSSNDDRKYALSVMNNLLGGDWMSSRLNLSVREKHAFAYNVHSSISFYSDCGTFLVQWGTDEKNLDKSIELIQKELKRLREQNLSYLHLNRSKRQILSQYAMIQENPSAVMQFKGKNILDYNRIITETEFFKKINEVSTSDILDVANEVLEKDSLSLLVYKND